MRAPREQRRLDVEADSTPTPPPFAVRVEAPPELDAPRRSWEKAAWLGAVLALPLAIWVGRGVTPAAEAKAPEAEARAETAPAEARPAPAAPAIAEPEPAASPRADARLN